MKCHNWCVALSSCLLSMCASNSGRDWTALTVRLDLCVLVLALCVHSTSNSKYLTMCTSGAINFDI